ncbi:hypothetical protein D918_06692 [Trichuris suis]|nr:hypothetical protein D918_06692 [Trichuris suis]
MNCWKHLSSSWSKTCCFLSESFELSDMFNSTICK